MAMEEALVVRLKAVSALSALGGRVSWFELPRVGGLPATLLTPVSTGRDWTHDGPDGLDRPRIQIDAYSLENTEALAMARAIRAEMEVSASAGGWTFHEAQLEFERWSVEDLDGGVKAFRIQQDFSFYHQPEE